MPPPDAPPLVPAPPQRPGFGWRTVTDWFLRFTNMREFARGDHFEQVHGVRISLALSVMSAVTLGWYHNTIIGGSLTHVKGHDLKVGLLAYLGFISGKKTEITKGKKDEKIFGLKVTQITGKKNQFQGSNRLENSAIQKAEFRNNCAEFWTARKELYNALKETVATLKREHASVEGAIAKCTKEYQQAKVEATKGCIRAASMKAKINDLLWQAQQAKASASADFKIMAGSAAHLEASAKWDGDLGSEVKLLSSSLQEFAASISKLG